MLIKLANPKILSDIVAIISELVTEVKIKIDKNGMSIIAIDPANVSLVAFKLPIESFSTFEANDETIGINLESLKQVLKRCDVGSSLVIQTEENVLKIEIYDKTKRTFKLALIDIEQEDKAMPMLDYSCKVEMSSMDFAEAVEDCIIVADSCNFSVSQNKFIIEAKGLNSTKSEFSEEIKAEGEGKAKYSLEYMQKFIRACKLSEKIRINFSNDYPLKIEFKENNFDLAFILAPRVESED